MSHKPSCKLPTKPSELIRVALADLKRAERTPNLIVDMDYWHEPEVEGDTEEAAALAGYDPVTCTVKAPVEPECTVCFAGSVMAFSLHAPARANVAPDSYPEPIERKLNALNEFREGCLYDGFRYLGWSEDKIQRAMRRLGFEGGISDHQVEVAKYADEPEQFKRDMTALAKRLAKAGY
jgi:hypothetical protein